MKKFKLPVQYDSLDWKKGEKRIVREQYIEEQKGKCMYCGNSLKENPPKEILDKPLNADLFPFNFLKHPIHLQHNHDTGWTEGAVHAYCNGVMWQYEGR